MSDIIHLNQERKARKRALQKKNANENAVKFGQTKAQKLKAKNDKDRAKLHLDGHKRQDHE